MFRGAIWVFAILFIFIAACILPWWFFPTMIVGGLLWWYISDLR